MVKTPKLEIGTELQDTMRNLEEVVSGSWQFINKIQENASQKIRDPKPVYDLYRQLREAASYEWKLFDLTRKYIEQAESRENSD